MLDEFVVEELEAEGGAGADGVGFRDGAGFRAFVAAEVGGGEEFGGEGGVVGVAVFAGVGVPGLRWSVWVFLLEE